MFPFHCDVFIVGGYDEIGRILIVKGYASAKGLIQRDKGGEGRLLGLHELAFACQGVELGVDHVGHGRQGVFVAFYGESEGLLVLHTEFFDNLDMAQGGVIGRQCVFGLADGVEYREVVAVYG